MRHPSQDIRAPAGPPGTPDPPHRAHRLSQEGPPAPGAACARPAEAPARLRYLWGTGLPILAALTLLGVGLQACRPGPYGWYGLNLLWNLFLAWVPYGVALGADLAHRAGLRSRLLQALLGLSWLAFLPNAPYILTDVVHLRREPSMSLHYDAVLISLFALTGCLLGAMSLLLWQAQVRRWFNPAASWAFVVAIVGLSGVGIYMGRVLRWNSWHLVTRPIQIADALAEALRDPLDHPRAITLSVLLAVFLLGSYILFYLLCMYVLGLRGAAAGTDDSCGAAEGSGQS